MANDQQVFLGSAPADGTGDPARTAFGKYNTHGHPVGDVTGLQALLDAKATAANPVFTGTVTVPDGALAIADTNGLQPALDLKAPINNAVFTGTFAAPAGTVTSAMLRNSTALSLIGRAANSAGVPADIVTTGGSGAVLRESGSTIGFGTIATAGLADAAVTSAKLRNSAALSVIGRSANSSGVPGDIATSAASGAVLRESGSAVGFGTVATAGLADDAVTYAKLQNVSAASRLLGRGSAAGAGNAEEIIVGSGLLMTGTTLSSTGGGGSGVAVEDDGVEEAAAATRLNFAGAGVSVSVSGLEATVNIPGGGSATLGTNIVNVMDSAGVFNDGSNFASTLTGINAAIAQCNADSNPQRLILYFPPGEYALRDILTPADGDYSIIMAHGAVLMYRASESSTPATYQPLYNRVMWQIGNVDNGAAVTNGVQRDGQGILRFELAAEGGGPGQDYTQANNVAFEFINIKHFSGHLRRANEFFTGLRMTADANNAAVDRHMYDVSWDLGYFHPCQHNIVQRTRGNGWMNNIRYRNGDFTGALAGSRYLNMITEGTIGQTSRGGENKAVFYDPVIDGNNCTALYVRGSTAMVHGGHMENPDWVIEHESGQANFAGDEPCAWIAPRLEAKQFLISDPDDVGSYAHDPFWGAAPKGQPKALTGSRNLTTGDVRTSRLLYNPGSSNWTVTIPDYGGGAQEPPLMAEVRFQRRSIGTLGIAASSGAALLVPSGHTAGVIQGGTVKATLISLDSGGNQLWALTGDLT